MFVSSSDSVNSPAPRPASIPKWLAVGMLVTTLVAAALAIYFGHQAWHSGASFSENIRHLMDSIPFDVTFLGGCSTGVIGTIAIIYHAIYRPQKRLLYEDQDFNHFQNLPALRLLYEDQGFDHFQNLPALKWQYSPTESEYVARSKLTYEGNTQYVSQLAENYLVLFEVLPNVPAEALKLIVQQIKASGQLTQFEAAMEEKLQTVAKEDMIPWENFQILIEPTLR